MKIKITYILSLTLLFNYSCGKGAKSTEGNASTSQIKEVVFASSDQTLVQSFDWAQDMALSYAHDNSDPVGYWYEAALPSRYAFCMRDMAHQSIGAEIIGLSLHNENMMTKFVENISDNKDWCSFWEIDKENKPAPVDYTDDDHFWYNLNANFDILQTALKLYEWTGNEKYLYDPAFVNFYEKSLNEYVSRWQLEADKIMDRPQFLNVKDVKNNSHRSTRGLPSYVENYPNLTASSDLIASIYAGFEAYSKIANIKNDAEESAKHKKIAEQYINLLDEKWWNEKDRSYYTFWTSKKEFANGEGLMHVLWFDAIKDPDRMQATFKKILETKNWNVENRSHFPMLFYRLNHLTEAYEELVALRTVPRCEYPEVSYGVLEGIVGGTMGIAPSYSQKRIITLPRLTTDKANEWLEIKNLPVFDGHISVRHSNNLNSQITNSMQMEFVWQASFMGEHKQIKVNNKLTDTQTRIDKQGNKVSYVDVNVPIGATAKAEVENK